MFQQIDTGYADTGGVEKSLPPCPHDSKEGNAYRMDFQSEKQDDKLAGFPVKFVLYTFDAPLFLTFHFNKDSSNQRLGNPLLIFYA